MTGAPTDAWRSFTELTLTPTLVAARDAFYELGFHGASVRDIAARAGLTVPALYYHHVNKEAMLLELLTIATTDVAWRVDLAAEEAGDDPRTALSAVAEAVVLHMTRLERIPALDTEARYLSGTNRTAYAAPRHHIENRVTAIIEDGVRAGQFDTRHPRELSRGLLAMWQATARWYRSDGPQTPEQVARTYAAIALTAAGHRGSVG